MSGYEFKKLQLSVLKACQSNQDPFSLGIEPTTVRLVLESLAQSKKLESWGLGKRRYYTAL